jgi:hypothetical protein
MSVALLGLAAYPENQVWPKVELLVRSARSRSPRTPVTLLTTPLGNVDRRLFKRFAVEAIECVDPPPRPGADRVAAAKRHWEWFLEFCCRRYALYREVIEARDESHFLLTDTRDAIVTAPLDNHVVESRLVLSQEHATTAIAANDLNRRWMVEGYGETGLAAVATRPILCCGTIFGPRQSIIAYLIAMSDEAHRIGAETLQRIGDQPLLAHLAYSGKLPEYAISTAEEGWMRSIGIMPLEEISIDWDQRRGPQPPPCMIVHQYDRHVQSRRVRQAVATAASLPWWHRWPIQKYVQYDEGVAARMLRAFVKTFILRSS